MICRKRFVKKLTALKFSFKGMTKSQRHELYMHGTTPVLVPRQDELLPDFVGAELRKIGLDKSDVAAFLADDANLSERERKMKASKESS